LAPELKTTQSGYTVANFAMVVKTGGENQDDMWFEAAQDAQAQQGIDIEAEIMAALAQEITVEMDQEILTSLRSLASVEETYDQAAVSGRLEAPPKRFPSEKRRPWKRDLQNTH